MTYRGYTIKQTSDDSYSVFIDGIEDMEDLPSLDAAKSFIDGKFNSPDVLETLKKYAPNVKHLTRNQVDNYVYYDPREFIDTDNVYRLAYKTKKDRISGLAQAKKNGFKVIDTTDNDEGRLPYWAFVVSTTVEESLQLELNEDDSNTNKSEDEDIYEYLSQIKIPGLPAIKSKSDLIDRIIKIVVGEGTIFSNNNPEPEDDYWNIYAATVNEDISTQYSYNIVYNAIDEILEDVFYPIIRRGIKKTGDPLQELEDAIENDLDVKSELAYINDLVSEYGDALEDVIDPDGAGARYYDKYQADNDVDDMIMARFDSEEN